MESYNAVFKYPQKKLILILGEVSDSYAEKVFNETSIDIKEYTQIWRSNDIKHVVKRHGIGNEKNPVQKGLGVEDIIAALEVIRTPEKIEKGSTTNSGEPSIRFIKNYSDGEFTVVEVVRESNKTLSIKTMWKKITNKHHGESALLDTSETAIGS